MHAAFSKALRGEHAARAEMQKRVEALETIVKRQHAALLNFSERRSDPAGLVPKENMSSQATSSSRAPPIQRPAALDGPGGIPTRPRTPLTCDEAHEQRERREPRRSNSLPEGGMMPPDRTAVGQALSRRPQDVVLNPMGIPQSTNGGRDDPESTDSDDGPIEAQGPNLTPIPPRNCAEPSLGPPIGMKKA